TENLSQVYIVSPTWTGLPLEFVKIASPAPSPEVGIDDSGWVLVFAARAVSEVGTIHVKRANITVIIAIKSLDFLMRMINISLSNKCSYLLIKRNYRSIQILNKIISPIII